MASEFPVEEVRKESSLDPSHPADPEVLPPVEESTLGGDQMVQKKRGRGRPSEGKEGQRDEAKKRAAPMASPLDRPSRERKSVQRFAALSPRVTSATKAVVIQQGSGEKLKDIPNVVFKLSKRKAHEGLRVLHTVLFGRKANVHFIKRDILQFSGFVWSEDKEEKRSKLKEKLNKFPKDTLLDFCNILDIYALKAATKKEDVLARLLEFLESPHVTREVILAEKDKKGKKRKRGAKRIVKRAPEETSPEKQRKKKKRDLKDEAKEGLMDPAKANKEVNDKGDSIDEYDEPADEEKNSDDVEISELSKDNEKDEETEHELESTKKMSESEQNSPTVREVSHATSKTVPSSPKEGYVEDESKVPSEGEADFLEDTKGSSMVSATSKKVMPSTKKKIDADGKSKVSSKSTAGLPKKESSKRKNDKVDNLERKVDAKPNRSKKVDEKKGKSSIRTASKDSKGSKKQNAKAKSSIVGKKQAKEKNVLVEPSAEQLSAVIGEILKEVDFNVATLADIIRQLGGRFDTDLMHRKTEIKQILQEVINNMTDEDEEDVDGADIGAEEGDTN